MTQAVSIAQSGSNNTTFRNRIINGAMMIDQRNNGASVTPASGQFIVDRFRYSATQSSKFTAQQNAGAVTPPAGFINYLGFTSTSAYSVTGNDAFVIEHVVEGYNVADLNWGTANAQPATLSFWVRSSLTGTFGGSLATANGTVWVLPFSFVISSANTWTYITVPVPAGTSSVPFTDNRAGIYVRFGLGSTGTNVGGTSGVWTSAGNYIQPAGTVSVVGTSGATFYITGVQLEKGTAATPFEQRLYGTELALCQRYYEVTGTTGTNGSFIISGYVSASGQVLRANVTWAVPKRTTPTVSIVGTWGASGLGQPAVGGHSETGARFDATSTTSGIVYVYAGASGNCITSSAEL